MLMLRQIVSGEYTFGPEWEDVSSSAKDLVRTTWRCILELEWRNKR